MQQKLANHNLSFVMLGILSAIGLSIIDILALYPRDKLFFIDLTVALFLYIGWEVRRLFIREPSYFYIAPPVLASLITLLISYGIGNFFFLGRTEGFLYDGTLGATPFFWMNQAMVYILIAAFALWRGYYFTWGREQATSFKSWLRRKGFLRRSFQVRWSALLFCIGISIAARVLMISKGVFGYTTTPDALANWAPYKQTVDFAAESGKLALVGLALAYYSNESRTKLGLRLLFMADLFIEVGFGFLSGFKNAVVVPIIIVGLCYYIVRKRLPILWIALVLPLLFTAYQVVEPYRYAYNNEWLQSKNLMQLTKNVASTALSERANYFMATQFGFAYLMHEVNLTANAARSIAYKNEIGLAPEDPKFLQNVLLSPLYAYIPRLLWASKPKNNIGWWFNVHVMGRPVTTTNAVAMSSVGYLYFAGGFVAIFFGFFAIGMLERFLFESFALSGGGGWIVFLGVLWPIATLDSAVNGIFTTIFRYVPVLLFAQYFLFSAPSYRHHRLSLANPGNQDLLEIHVNNS